MISVLSEERHEYIVDKIKVNGFVRVSDLAEELNVTTRTIRRDLEELEARGLLKRTHGGARWTGQRAAEAEQVDLPWSTRAAHMEEEKRRIAQAAVGLLEPNSHVILDAGTTTLHVARALPPGLHLTVITNSVHIAAELGHRNDVELIVTGGHFRSSTWSLVGPSAVALLENISADIAFMGTTGINSAVYFTNSNLFEAEVKKAMIRAAAQAWVLADHTKFDLTALARFATADEVTGIITDSGVSEEVRRRLAVTRLQVRYV